MDLNKNILVVIDDERIFNFPESDWDVVHFTHKADAQHALIDYDSFGKGEIHLSLDHDLGDDGDIMPFVDWLQSELRFDFFPRLTCVFVHSMNPTAFDKIRRALERYVKVVRIDCTRYLD